MTKLNRQRQIRDIIETRDIETQEELMVALRNTGVEVTQATISRDIKEMVLVKIPSSNGGYKYASQKEKQATQAKKRLEKLFVDHVEGIDFSDNTIVIKTMPGLASAVAGAIDMVNWHEIIGTVAGDDTLIVIVKPSSATEKIVERFSALV